MIDIKQPAKAAASKKKKKVGKKSPVARKVTSKVPGKKAAVARKAAGKTVRKKRVTAMKAAVKNIREAVMTPGERHRMIAEIAFLRAEGRGFKGGDPVKDWLEAEQEVESSRTE